MPNIEIVNLGEKWASYGFFLEDGNSAGQDGKIVPKLMPFQVVEVPEDHVALKSPLIRITTKETNRPYSYDSLADGYAYRMSAQKAADMASMVEGSIEYNRKAREGEVDFSDDVHVENSLLKQQLTNQGEQIAAMMQMIANNAAPVQAEPEAEPEAKPKRSRRKKVEPKPEADMMDLAPATADNAQPRSK